LHCGVHKICTPDADQLVAQTMNVEAPLVPALYAEAEREMIDNNVFLPLGAPYAGLCRREYAD
jgi:hypothetical protein